MRVQVGSMRSCPDVYGCPAAGPRSGSAWAQQDHPVSDGVAYRGGMPADRAALGQFLRARRDRLSPAQAGIQAFPGPRRVPGLRKEELAVLAGLSPDYYSRLEQGRQANISDGVLASLSRALRLDEVEH